MDGLPELPLPDTTAAFAPPVVAATQFAEPTVAVVAHAEPKRRRTGRLIGAGVLAVAALASGALVLLNKDKAEATYSLTEANAAAAETTAAAFTMTMSAMGEDVTAEAEMDTTSGLSHIVMELGVVDGSVEMIADTKAKTVYFKSSFFEGIGLSVDTEWIKFDEEILQEQAVGDESIFDSANLGNPLAAAAVFENAKSVTEIGFDEVDGVKVKHFEVVVDALDAMKASPALQQQFDQLDADLPSELTYDVYVDEQNQIRRTNMEITLAGQKVVVDIVIKPLTEPLVIEVPKPADVTDFADLL